MLDQTGPTKIDSSSSLTRLLTPTIPTTETMSRAAISRIDLCQTNRAAIFRIELVSGAGGASGMADEVGSQGRRRSRRTSRQRRGASGGPFHRTPSGGAVGEGRSGGATGDGGGGDPVRDGEEEPTSVSWERFKAAASRIWVEKGCLFGLRFLWARSPNKWTIRLRLFRLELKTS